MNQLSAILEKILSADVLDLYLQLNILNLWNLFASYNSYKNIENILRFKAVSPTRLKPTFIGTEINSNVECFCLIYVNLRW